jgi:pimeloyl-ACP methyl ester carboxylesterase
MDADLVLIHGFWSSPKTWDNLTRRLAADNDLAGLRVHGFPYPSPKLPPRPGTRIPGYNDIAHSLPDYLESVTKQSDTAIVTHSQGGLILQRYLAWMLDEGRGRELETIKLIVMLACPNEGSEYLALIRRKLNFDWHPQAQDLVVFNETVAATRRIVGKRVDLATAVGDFTCPIPIYAYAGVSDDIVSRLSAQSIFSNVGSLPGDHFSIHNPDAPDSNTFPTLKRLLRENLHQTGRQIEGAAGYSDRDRRIRHGEFRGPRTEESSRNSP